MPCEGGPQETRGSHITAFAATGKQQLPTLFTQDRAGSRVYSIALEQELHSSTERNRVEVVAG